MPALGVAFRATGIGSFWVSSSQSVVWKGTWVPCGMPPRPMHALLSGVSAARGQPQWGVHNVGPRTESPVAQV